MSLKETELQVAPPCQDAMSEERFRTRSWSPESGLEPPEESHGPRGFDEVDSHRVFGSYALPIAAPDMVGNREAVGSNSFDLRLLRLSEEHDDSARGQSGSSGGTWRAWRRYHLGPGFQIILVLVYTAVEAAKILLSVKALRDVTPTDGQVLVVVQGTVSVLSGVIFTVAWEGKSGLAAAFSPSCILRCLPVSLGFSLSQTALAVAICKGLGAAVIMVTGYLYMPLCAFLSAVMFRRLYGWLEIHGLAFLTLTIMIFMELIARASSLSKSLVAVPFNLASIVFSCLASVYLEKLLKPKYNERSSLIDQHFYIQKVWLELGGLLLSLPILLVLRSVTTKEGIFAGSWFQMLEVAFNGIMCAAILARVVQSWFTGYVSKYLSTLGRSVIQCVAVIAVHLFETVISSEQWDLTTSLLALAVCLSAMMYQVGRRMTSDEQGPKHEVNEALVDEPERASGRSSSCLVPDASLMSCEFESPRTTRPPSPAPPRQAPRIGLLDRAWYEHARRLNSRLTTWLSSKAGLSTQVLCVVSFILADASRNLVNAWAIRDTPIVQQSIVWALSATSIPVGVLMSAALDGMEGARASLLWRDALTCFPVAACFSLGQTLQIKAYGAGISASVNTVLGYFYMPMSALLSRWVFQRAYSPLEWMALALLSLTAVIFCLLRSSRATEDSTSTLAMACCLGSVISSCIGSLMCEKIMKARPYPFYTQKVHLEFGGLATATGMLFIVGSLSSRAEDAFWKPRPVDGQMEAGLFVGWSLKTTAALCAAVLQSWLGGLVSKRLSTVVRSVAQCLSLLIIYFVGDLVIRGLEFDWIVGAAAVVVALSVQVFTLAGQRRLQT